VTAAKPFAPGYSPEFFVETSACGEALGRLKDGLGAREPFLLVTGEPGTGKTALAHEAIRHWGENVSTAFLAYPALTGVEMLEEILRRFGAESPEGASRPKLVACLERAFADVAVLGQVAVIVVDDAHTLSPEALEELRLLVNAAQQAGHPIEVLLVGLPALEATLDQPAMSGLRQRISVRAQLVPLSSGETRRYLRHRATAAGCDGAVLFPRAACHDIAAQSGGVPRRINLLAAEALRLAREASDPAVQPEHVTAAAARLHGSLPKSEPDDEPEVRKTAPVAPAAPAAPAAPVAPRAAAPAAKPAQAVPAAPAPAPAAPTVAPAAPAVAPAAAKAPVAPVAGPTPAAQLPPVEDDAAVKPVIPQSQDPREWVARFIGDKGPLQIGSQAVARANWAPEPFEPDEMAPDPPELIRGRRRRPPPAAKPRSRSGHRRGQRVAMAGLLAVAIAVTAIVLVIRAGGFAHNHAATASRVATVATAPVQDGAAPSSAPPVKKAPAIARASAPGDNIRGPYTLDVGGYADLQQALEQRDRVQQLTGIESWVVPAPEGSGELNRIVVGIYRARRRADATAAMLLNSKTLGDVKVVTLPPRAARN